MATGVTARDLNNLLDRAAISDTKLRYATGIDRRDWPLYRSVFVDSVDIDFPSWVTGTITADKWVEEVRDILDCFDSTQHVITNHVITLDGDHAQLVAYLVARHCLGGEIHMLGGYYTDRLRRDGECWKITACSLTVTWEQGDRGLFQRAKANSRSQDTDRV